MSKKTTETRTAEPAAGEVPVIDAHTGEVREEPAPENQISTGAAEPRLPARATGLPQFSPAPGTESIGREDVKIPRLKLMQGMSDEVQAEANPAPLGAFVRSDSGEVLRKHGVESAPLYILPLAMAKGRGKFVEKKRVYWSDDSFVHSPAAPEREDGIFKCAECPDAQWGVDPETGRPTKPPCGMQYTYPVLLLNADGTEIAEYMPFLFTLRSTSADAAKQMNTPPRFSGKEFYHFVFALTTERVPGPSGTYYVTHAKLARRLKDEVPADAALRRTAEAVFAAVNMDEVRRASDEAGEGDDF